MLRLKRDTVGQRIYYLDEKEIGSVNLLAEETVKKQDSLII